MVHKIFRQCLQRSSDAALAERAQTTSGPQWAALSSVNPMEKQHQAGSVYPPLSR
jgi:hypothetical protein